jgi:hypothetical protein
MIEFTQRLGLDHPRGGKNSPASRITTIPTSQKSCTTAKLMHDQNKVEACRRPNRLYRYKSRGFPAVRTSTPVSVILKADQSRRALSVRGTLTTTSLQTEHFSSHLRSSLSNYPANELRPNSPQDLSSTAGMSVYIRAHHTTASYGLDGKALCSRFIANILSFGASGHAPFPVS